MVIRVVYTRFDPQRVEEIEGQLRVLAEQLRARFTQLDGFGSWQSGADRPQGRSISITTWETRAQAEGVSAAIADIIGQYQAIGVTFAEPEFYETPA